ncbi:MAG: hypothetical protein ACSHXA_07620 [Polaribacter sp.]|uniref:hypothetical protein n=1 Tax=Polaribacter sp. TaxID=1920175 RepID=UPI003EFA728B
MSLLEDRQKTSKAIAEGRFVDFVLQQESASIDTAVKEKMSSFTSSFWSKRNFSTSNNQLTYTTLTKHRFADMKTRQTPTGVVRKKRYEIHNKPIFGHLNNIVRELSYGFTGAIRDKFYELEKEYT